MRPRLALLLGLLLAGCGGGDGPLRVVGARPPAGAEPAGKRAERQGGADPSAGEPIFRLQAGEGERLRYAVTLRNATEAPVTVAGVVADEDRDGAFVPQGVVGAPLQIAPGSESTVEIEGVVRGCRFGAQSVPLAGPELRLGDGETQELGMPIRTELRVGGC